MICTIIKAGRSDEYGRALTPGSQYSGTINQVRSLVMAGFATTTEPLDDVGAAGLADAYGPATPISSDVTLTENPADPGILAGTHIMIGRVYACTAALTVACPDNLPASVTATVFVPPATGNLSIDPTGTATVNGAATTLTRAWSANYGGVSIISRGAGVYGATGA